MARTVWIRSLPSIYTTAVPAAYREASAQPGKVTRLDYDSEDYARDSAPITKTAYVYTPYGYDENDAEKRYNILYLMHGWGGHAGEYFEYADIKNMFDNLIERGDIPPIIIVSATFYNPERISDERFGVLSKEYEEEQKRLKLQCSELESSLDSRKKKTDEIRSFANLVEQYTNITEVTSELLHVLIDRIVIHEKEVADDEIIMKVDIYYRFIGSIGNEVGKDLKAPKIHHRRWAKKPEFIYEDETGENGVQ